MRSTNNVASRRRRKKVLKAARGYYSGRHRLFQNAKETVKRALRYSYRDRRQRKRNFRRLWIARINAVCREAGISYSRFMNGLHIAGIALDRKSLAHLAVHDVAALNKLVEVAREALKKANKDKGALRTVPAL